MSDIAEVIRHFPSDLQDPMIQFWEFIKDELGVKREDFTELKKREFAESQKEFAEYQKRTRVALQCVSDNIDFKLGGLERRCGITSESSFRSRPREILLEAGCEVFNFIENDAEGMVFGHQTEIEIDVIIKGDRTIVVEIKSSVSMSDVYVFMRKAEFYTHISGRKVDRLLMITPFIDDAAREVADTYQVVICDSISDLGVKVQQS